VLLPMEPVEPRMEMVRINAAILLAASS